MNPFDRARDQLPDEGGDGGLGDDGLIAVSFPDAMRAHEFLMAVKRIAAQDTMRLHDAVLVVKHDDGSVVVQETIDPQPGRSAISGALWAGLLGLLVGGPVGWIAGIGVGAGVGAGVAKVVDLGIPDEWVTWFRDAVQPGTATIVVLLEDVNLTLFRAEVERFPEAVVLHTTLRAGALEQITGTAPADMAESGPPPAREIDPEPASQDDQPESPQARDTRA